jgi:arginyl-tRNA synthetase
MIKEELAFVISQALETAKMSGDLPLETIPVVTLEMPKQKAHGDWATSVALGLAKTLGMPPREVAAKIVSHLPVGDDALIAGAEIAGPGFINLRLRPGWLGDILTRIETEGAAFGRSDSGQDKKVPSRWPVDAMPLLGIHCHHC